jgi:transposase
MAMGTRQSEQGSLWVATAELPKSPGHPFYTRLNALLDADNFDRFVEGQCARFYAPVMGRPSLAPGRYFRLLLIGYFEGLDAERGIAWRATDSLALRSFLRLALDEAAPDHSTISRTRRIIDLETTARCSRGCKSGWWRRVCSGAKPSRLTPPCSKRTRQCAALCAATPGRAIRSS